MNTIAKVALVAVIVLFTGLLLWGLVDAIGSRWNSAIKQIAGRRWRWIKKRPRIRRSVCGTERLRAGGRQICLS